MLSLFKTWEWEIKLDFRALAEAWIKQRDHNLPKTGSMLCEKATLAHSNKVMYLISISMRIHHCLISYLTSICVLSEWIVNLQAFWRTRMPEPLDLRWWDTVRGAVQGLSAASLDSPGLLRGNCLFSNLWLHCEQILTKGKRQWGHIVIVSIINNNTLFIMCVCVCVCVCLSKKNLKQDIFLHLIIVCSTIKFTKRLIEFDKTVL